MKLLTPRPARPSSPNRPARTWTRKDRGACARAVREDSRTRHDLEGCHVASHPASRGGFTILEVIVAMGILLFGMTAVLALLTFGSALSRSAHLRTNAAAAVQSVMADLEETLFPLVNGEAGEPKAIVKRALHDVDTVVYSAFPAQNPDRPLEYRVDVELAWKSAGVQREKRFTTILLREISFGERLRRQFVEGDTQALKSTRQTDPPSGSKTDESKPATQIPEKKP